MISKTLEKKIEIAMQEMPGEVGNTLELEYYLVENHNEMTDDIVANIGYGVEIIKKENGLIIESKMIKNIYINREITEKFLKTLALNTVTPVTLTYVVEDVIGA
jgi:hypothetical protein